MHSYEQLDETELGTVQPQLVVHLKHIFTNTAYFENCEIAKIDRNNHQNTTITT